jgi:hypothetical protein
MSAGRRRARGPRLASQRSHIVLMPAARISRSKSAKQDKACEASNGIL